MSTQKKQSSDKHKDQNTATKKEDKTTSEHKNPFWKVALYDLAGVGCLILVPFLGPLPGPGGIPLLITGFGLLSVNHEWAKKAVKYTKKHSESIREVIFPPNPKIELLWDVVSAGLLIVGVYMSFRFDHVTLLKILSIGLMAASTTLFMLNRNRLEWFETKLLKKK